MLFAAAVSDCSAKPGRPGAPAFWSAAAGAAGGPASAEEAEVVGDGKGLLVAVLLGLELEDARLLETRNERLDVLVEEADLSIEPAL